MSTPSPTKPLATRDVNTSSPSPTKLKAEKPATEKEDANKPMSMEYHRQVLQSRLDEEKYVIRELLWGTTLANGSVLGQIRNMSRRQTRS